MSPPVVQAVRIYTHHCRLCLVISNVDKLANGSTTLPQTWFVVHWTTVQCTTNHVCGSCYHHVLVVPVMLCGIFTWCHTAHCASVCGCVFVSRKRYMQEAQLSLTNCATLYCKVVEVLQDFLSENVDKKFTTDYNVA